MPYEITTFALPCGVKAMRGVGVGVITKEDADLLMQQLSPGGPYFGLPRLFLTQQMERMVPEARTVFSGPSHPGLEAVWTAAVVTSAVIRVTTNFMLRVSRSRQAATMKMFSGEKEAMAWLDERVREGAPKQPGSTT